MSAVLAVNAGSSSLKFALLEGQPPLRRVSGRFQRIGEQGSPRDHAACLDALLGQLGGAGFDAIGHRVVHGGPSYFEPTLVTPAVIEELRRLSPFAPEHLPAGIALIEALGRRFPELPQVACFDTAFHHELPAVSRVFPIPREYESLGIRRYGFHGLSYAYVVEELKREGVGGRMVLAHLGGGSSLAAVLDGKPMDTTMGFTPASGIPMSTRSGDLDPGLYPYLARTEGMTPEAFNRMVNQQSGIRGISGGGKDIRELLEFKGEDPRVEEALSMYIYHVKKAIGAYAAALGGIDVLTFSGGVGENARTIRGDVCRDLGFMGIELDPDLNGKNERVISSVGSKVKVYVIKTDEELQIARYTVRALGL